MCEKQKFKIITFFVFLILFKIELFTFRLYQPKHHPAYATLSNKSYTENQIIQLPEFSTNNLTFQIASSNDLSETPLLLLLLFFVTATNDKKLLQHFSFDFCD